jgi:hypothetical protein
MRETGPAAFCLQGPAAAILCPFNFPHQPPAMPQDKQDKQKKLDQDYADFLVEYEAGRVQGTFLAWMHETGRNGIKIPMTRAERNNQTG